MKYEESDTVELKELLNQDFKKEVVAFANTFGGTIYIGIKDNGEVIGLANSRLVSDQVSGMIRDGIKSDLTLFTRIKENKIDGKNVVTVIVKEGSNKPYYIAEKGMKPTGVFIRHGKSSIPATDETIKMMLKQYKSGGFEDSISIEQKLDLSDLKHRFEKLGIKLESSKLKSFGLIDNVTGSYSKLAFLLSNKNPFTIKCGVYSDKTVKEFVDQKEFKGNLIEQFDEVQKYLTLLNKISGKITGFKRVDNKDYPDFALREALVNACIHRSYEFSGSIVLHIYTNRIEIVSLGGLVRGLTLDDALEGISEKRNPKLAEIFRRLNYIEGYGTGIKRILSSYDQYEYKPEFKATPNIFACILPNTNYIEPVETKPMLIDEKDKETILKSYLEKYGSITRKEIELLFRIEKSYAGRIINEFIEKGLIKAEGSNKMIKYVLK